MSAVEFPRLHFREELDELTAFEIKAKGWYNGTTVELSDGRRVVISFYDPARLAKEIQSEFSRGSPVFAEPLLLVVPEVTEPAMRAAVASAFASGWFNDCLAT
jgi:hypothetical protein